MVKTKCPAKWGGDESLELEFFSGQNEGNSSTILYGIFGCGGHCYRCNKPYIGRNLQFNRFNPQRKQPVRVSRGLRRAAGAAMKQEE
jgi:hypothetical protein